MLSEPVRVILAEFEERVLEPHLAYGESLRDSSRRAIP